MIFNAPMAVGVPAPGGRHLDAGREPHVTTPYDVAVRAPAGVNPDRYVPELESLRGLAILLVLMFHLLRYVRPVELSKHSGWLAVPLAFPVAGATGVSLFFVLSGFLLSGPFLAEARGEARVDRGHYFRRRALRILPAYYVTVLIGALCSAPLLDVPGLALPYLAFLNGLPGWARPMPPFSDVMWSLATEVQFYALLPFLPYALRSRRGRGVGTFLLLAYAALYAAFIAGRLPLRSIEAVFLTGLSIAGRGWLFLTGIAAAAVYQRWRPLAVSRRVVFAADVALLTLLVALGGLLRWVHAAGEIEADFPPAHAWHILEGLLWAGILLILVRVPVHARRLFHNPPLAWLGEISYSAYLVHLPVIVTCVAVARLRLGLPVLGANLETLVSSAVIVGLVVTLSALMFVLVERPFLRRKQRLVP